MTASWPTREDRRVLHAVRLAGFADPSGVAARVELPVGEVAQLLDGLLREGSVDVLALADSRGWVLTEAGKARDGEWLAEELEASGLRPLLESTAERFESVNARLVEVVTAWQLRPPAGERDGTAELLRRLAPLATRLEDVMAAAVLRLPRLGRYPRQFRAALDAAAAGDLDLVAGVGRLSCHTVWAELHEDLLSSLGRDRSPGAPGRR